MTTQDRCNNKIYFAVEITIIDTQIHQRERGIGMKRLNKNFPNSPLNKKLRKIYDMKQAINNSKLDKKFICAGSYLIVVLKVMRIIR